MKFLAQLSLVLGLLLLPNKRLRPGHLNRFILWDVGQGQWLTWSTLASCYHFDMGGEKMDWTKLRFECQQKSNYLFLSHGDWDHIGGISRAQRTLPLLCLAQPPKDKLSRRKKRILSRLKVCTNPLKTNKLKELTENLQHKKSAKANSLSRVYIAAHSLLVPGDSPRAQEKRWLREIRYPENITQLVLGHHGSRTSTSKQLLKVLGNLKITFASARKARYGHPHIKVQEQLKNRGLPLLTTEDWGNLIFHADEHTKGSL